MEHARYLTYPPTLVLSARGLISLFTLVDRPLDYAPAMLISSSWCLFLF